MPPKTKKYHAVVRGPHPKVTGLSGAIFKGFLTIEAARRYMKERGVANPSEVIKDGAGSKAPVGDDPCFYAIANGKHPGVYTDYQPTRMDSVLDVVLRKSVPGTKDTDRVDELKFDKLKLSDD
ncbi:hypothetical protein UVI_02000350 [Ustilaginoidea virens]|uniref:Ribonuclease H1 N-terminal domain-containing protein n=1 Tax=Ustilaginoidea virens TaxID=1159556 RepID=A0A1B5KYT7_USTVR|nr:hypothetical protein UVI_02000350 [Ustilaginoidea virens]